MLILKTGSRPIVTTAPIVTQNKSVIPDQNDIFSLDITPITSAHIPITSGIILKLTLAFKKTKVKSY